MAKGYTGRVLVVDLTTGTVQEDKLEERLYRHFIGGLGLGVRLLYQRQSGKVDPLGEQNILGFIPGLLSGTGAPGSSRLTVVAKSSLTGTWGDANVGGYMARELKRAGYDGILIQGISHRPVYLLIHQGKAELRDASHLWGKETTETVEILRKEIGDSKLRIGCIGPAGELKSAIASIIFDKGRAAGRSGLGAIMGSKYLKAVAVRGQDLVPVADQDRFRELRRNLLTQIKETKAAAVRTKVEGKGTIAGIESLVTSGATPIKNWRLNGADAIPFLAKISGPAVNSYVIDGSRGLASCADCPIACGALVKSEKDGIGECHRPEYETVAGFGALCFNEDLASIIRASDFCNRYGLDIISASSTIAFAIECYEQGIISKKDTDGIELRWNDGPTLLTLLDKIARREGFGDVLADGVRKAVQRIGHGAEQYAIHVYGQEPGFHDARLLPARGTNYIADPTPGRHTTGLISVAVERGNSPDSYVEFNVPEVELYDYGNKKVMYGIVAKYEQVFASCGLCKFIFPAGPIRLPELISAVTGWDYSPSELLETGERIQTMRQLFNIREGIEPNDFQLPLRLSQPADIGPLKDIPVNFNLLRRQYYEGMGWSTTGYPLPSRLNELGLADVVKEDW